jgi:hypothetical protein
LAGWDWARARGYFEKQSGVRWGLFALTGTFDGSTLVVTKDPIPGSLYDIAGEPISARLESRCDEPDGGWTVTDSAKVGEQARQATVEAASRLDGFGGLFMTSGVIDLRATDVEPQVANSRPPEADVESDFGPLPVMNVLVTGDVNAAEMTLRKTWGGPLCVTNTDSTETDRRRIATALDELPGVISSSAGTTVVEVTVVYDDGSLQAQVDDEYGDGSVVVTSALRDVGR